MTTPSDLGDDTIEPSARDVTLEQPIAPHPLDAEVVDDEWPSAGPARGVRVRWPAGVLVVAIAVLGGMWGGAYLQRDQASATQLTTARTTGGGQRGSGRNAGFNAGGGQGGGSGGGGGFAGRGGVVGDVVAVTGNQIVLTTPAGDTVTVNVGSSTTISKSTTASLSDVTPGQSIVVRGSTASDGTTDAQAITIGAPGGFGGGGNGSGFGNGGGGGAPGQSG